MTFVRNIVLNILQIKLKKERGRKERKEKEKKKRTGEGGLEKLNSSYSIL